MGGLVLAAPVGDWRQEGAVRLHHQPIQGREADGVLEGLRLLVGHHAGQRDVEAQIQVAPRRGGVSGEAVDDPSLEPGLPKNGLAVLVSIPHVHHQRLPQRARERALAAEHLGLNVPGRPIIVVVQPGLSHRPDLGPGAGALQRDEVLLRGPGGFMGVNAQGRRQEVRIRRGYLQRIAPVPGPLELSHHHGVHHPGGPSARQHGRDLRIVRALEVAMGVDQSHGVSCNNSAISSRASGEVNEAAAARTRACASGSPSRQSPSAASSRKSSGALTSSSKASNHGRAAGSPRRPSPRAAAPRQGSFGASRMAFSRSKAPGTFTSPHSSTARARSVLQRFWRRFTSHSTPSASPSLARTPAAWVRSKGDRSQRRNSRLTAGSARGSSSSASAPRARKRRLSLSSASTRTSNPALCFKEAMPRAASKRTSGTASCSTGARAPRISGSERSASRPTASRRAPTSGSVSLAARVSTNSSRGSTSVAKPRPARRTSPWASASSRVSTPANSGARAGSSAAS
ncbi:hypothetical protein STIAU_7316 [Stigmatella aurantiaca DW4/3-1]|uniref:Uncharacterized protein n=1 Tax=Stigmatella aurantiaca (strain DW4/3-1) TaxID=378806 RepID=Q08S94_STIAD|nr:hypothetical protein STIAU_7316 [Stigmatella aurantiaca DW4/3-1]